MREMESEMYLRLVGNRTAEEASLDTMRRKLGTNCYAEDLSLVATATRAYR